MALKQETKNKIITNVIYFVIIVALLAIITFQRRNPVIRTIDNSAVYKDSIKLMQVEIDRSHKAQADLERSYDSLSNIEPTLIYKNREKIKLIYTSNNPNELDSIIRSGWKTKPRYN